MGLLMFFEKIPRAAIEELSQSNNQLLFEWINKIICLPLEVDANSDVEFTQEHLECLMADLRVVNAENCHFYFPDWSGHYDDNYWHDLKEMRHWGQQMLDSFNFKTDKLMFSCSW